MLSAMFGMWPFRDLSLPDSTETSKNEGVGEPFFPSPVAAPEPAGEAARPLNPLPLMGWIDHADSTPPMPTSLDPNAPRKIPGIGGTKQSPDSIHQANVTKADATKLLTSKEMDNRGDKAVQALDLLNGLPPDQRGKVIDGLDDAAFDNLLSRVPPDQRSGYQELVASSKNPERKLRMWKEAHLAKVRNEVNATKGDVGSDDLQTEYDRQKLYSTKSLNEQIAADDAWEKAHHKQLDKTDDDGNVIPDRKRTLAQQENLREHQTQVRRASHTKEEVDHEYNQLQKKGKLELGDVEAMIARKEKEYSLERKHDLDLSGTIAGGSLADSSTVWSEKEMDTIDHTLGVLPRDHHHGHHKLAEIWKSNDTGVNGRWHDDHKQLEIAAPVFTSPDKVRNKVGREFVGTNEQFVTQLESTLTHELGHEYADSHADVYEKFKTVAGWKQVAAKDASRDGVTDAQIANLEANRDDPHTNQVHEYGKRKTYSVNQDSDTNKESPYWGIDQSAIPQGSGWQYSHVNPQEHFADSYRTAVLDPARFHRDLVSEPMADAKKARDRVVARKNEIAALANVPENQARIKELRERMAKDVSRAEEADRSVRQLGDQYDVIRNDVFGGDKATSAAAQRLRSRNVDAKRVQEFEARASELSTPAQIETLEAQFR
jgi:hypothetical protein